MQPQQSVAVAVAVRVAIWPHLLVPGARRLILVFRGESGGIVQVIVPPVPSPPGVQFPPPASVTRNPWGTLTVTVMSLVPPPPQVLSPENETERL